MHTIDINKMEIIKKIGDMTLIESGSIVLNQSDNLLFTLDDLTFEFVFINTEEDEKKPYLKLRIDGKKKIKFLMSNYNNPLGTGSSVPINLATLSSGEEVYFQYAIHGINELKIFHYSWYLKPKSMLKEGVSDNEEPKSVEK